ncbi:hypothetical protein AKI39_19395 [Bordetella sp. H567]|uniref:hypothetical protein n=1 Tax=Bordetella sp. H567 TaxID=1697043 RepID=UPI00081C9CBE|nr:hypothetical protein [Bordetella sp. H567]AOB32422.1 hypothetical protein AKI39_19395 [Bordetella sp. H567]
MAPSPNQSDIDEVLELFGHSPDQDATRSMLQEMRDIEEAARRLMRTRLRRQEFSEVAALAEASKAAQTILACLHADR